jgi:CoA:oxalate CoA-transferase
LGEVVLPNSPLRLHGAARVQPVPSPGLGQHNQEVYGDWLGLGGDAVAALARDGVI